MPLPESLKINGLVYKVRTDNDVALDAAKAWGFTVMSKQEISIDSTATSARQQKTLCHELLHAIEDRDMEEFQLNERKITSLAVSLFQVFKDNPDLLDYLKED